MREMKYKIRSTNITAPSGKLAKKQTDKNRNSRRKESGLNLKQGLKQGHRRRAVKAHFVVQSDSVVHWRQKNRKKKAKKKKENR